MKGSLINKMPGDTNQKFANLRTMYAYMMAHPGKKLLFMGGDIAQYREWNFEESIDWHLLEDPYHAHLQKMLSDDGRIAARELKPGMPVEVEVETGPDMIGIVVDSVSDVMTIKDEDIEANLTFGKNLDTDYIFGMAKVDGAVKILIDIDKVLNTDEVTMLENVV